MVKNTETALEKVIGTITVPARANSYNHHFLWMEDLK